MNQQRLGERTKEDLVDTIAKILKGERHLEFLSELRLQEAEILVAGIRDWMDQEKKYTVVTA